MAKIALMISPAPDKRSKTLALLHKLTGASLHELSNTIDAKRPVIERSLYFSDHGEVAALLLESLAALPALGAGVRIFETPDDVTFESCPPDRRREITHEYLRNILRRADEERERQRRLMEHETQDDG